MPRGVSTGGKPNPFVDGSVQLYYVDVISLVQVYLYYKLSLRMVIFTWFISLFVYILLINQLNFFFRIKNILYLNIIYVDLFLRFFSSFVTSFHLFYLPIDNKFFSNLYYLKYKALIYFTYSSCVFYYLCMTVCLSLSLNSGI